MAFFIEGQVIVQLSDCIGQRSFSRFLLVEAEAIGVEAQAVDEIAASTSLMCTPSCVDHSLINDRYMLR